MGISLATAKRFGATRPSARHGSEHQRIAQDAKDFLRKKSRAAEAGVASTCTKPSSSASVPQLLYSKEASSKQSTAAWSPVALAQLGPLRCQKSSRHVSRRLGS